MAAAREQAARVLEAVGDGVMMVDPDGALRFWNRAAELVTGRSRDDVVGRQAGEVLADWQEVAAEIPISEEPELASPVTLPVEVDGSELWLSFVAVRSPNGIVYTFRDLTGDRGLEAAKSDFIATLSHELRTPMTAVLGAAKTLLRDDIALSPERRHQLLEMIGAQGTRLTQITEEVLLANRLDRGDLRIDSERVDLSQLASDAVETMRHDAPESISLSAANGAAEAIGDRDRIEQVLVNLIDNAVKYSPEGGEVVVSTVPAAASVRVEVADQGIGHRAGRARSRLREVLPRRPAASGRARRHRPRALHLPRAGAADGRHDRRPLTPGRGLDLLVRPAEGVTRPAESKTRTRC